MKARTPDRTEILRVNAEFERINRAARNEATAEEIRAAAAGQRIQALKRERGSNLPRDRRYDMRCREWKNRNKTPPNSGE